MKSLEHSFQELQDRFPDHSSYVNFIRLMKMEEVCNKRALARYFDTLVEKDDYSRSDREEIISVSLTMVKNKGILHTSRIETASGEAKLSQLGLCAI